MKYFHGKKKRLHFFEGWYFKQQEGEETISFIPGIQMDENECKLAFIQVIMKEKSHYFTFPINKFYANQDILFIRIDKNLFTRKGIYIDISQVNSRNEKVCIKGHFNYGSLTKVNYSIMGPLQYLPLPCKHGVISMRHQVDGSMQLDEKSIVMSHGIGYLETDYGTSFPRNYLWTQANATRVQAPQIFATIVTLPICKQEVLGCVAVIIYQGKQYRLATYLGAKILIVKESLAIIQQGRWTLCIHMDKERRAQELLAPCKGELSRKIKEDVKCVVRYSLYCGRRKVFDWTTRNASVEFVTNQP
jgi:hypothetical protein